MQLTLHARISNFNDKIDQKRILNLKKNVSSAKIGLKDNEAIVSETQNQINTLQLKNEILKTGMMGQLPNPPISQASTNVTGDHGMKPLR